MADHAIIDLLVSTSQLCNEDVEGTEYHLKHSVTLQTSCDREVLCMACWASWTVCLARMQLGICNQKQSKCDHEQRDGREFRHACHGNAKRADQTVTSLAPRLSCIFAAIWKKRMAAVGMSLNASTQGCSQTLNNSETPSCRCATLSVAHRHTCCKHDRQEGDRDEHEQQFGQHVDRN